MTTNTKVRAHPRVRLTRVGWAFLLMLSLVLAAAFNTGANLLYLVGAGLISFIFCSAIPARWSLSKLTVTRQGPDAVYRGERAPVAIRLENRRYLLPVFSLRIESANGVSGAAGYIPVIPPRRAAVLRVIEPFDHRGVYRLPDTVLTTGFPFGLTERRRLHRDGVEVVVFPRVRPIRPATLELWTGRAGQPQFTRGEGDEFFSLRDYAPGDDIRQIAWRVSARRGQPVVREWARQMSRTLVVVLDTYRRPDVAQFDDLFEDCIDLVASIAVTFLNRHYAVGVVTPFARVPAGEGGAHAYQVLDMLARVQPAEPGTPPPIPWQVPEGYAGAACVYASPDPREWGQRAANGRFRVLHPREVLLA